MTLSAHAGGDALASDLIWRELRVLAEKKPVIASMGDVAASGAPALAPPDYALLIQAMSLQRFVWGAYWRSPGNH